jgi:hypothetical protein
MYAFIHSRGCVHEPNFFIQTSDAHTLKGKLANSFDHIEGSFSIMHAYIAGCLLLNSFSIVISSHLIK